MLIKNKNIYEVRAFPAGVDRYSIFIEEQFIAIGWASMQDVSNLSDNEIKTRTSNLYPQYIQGTATKIANFFIRLKSMKQDDIILIPYISSEDGPILTIARVVEGYKFHKEYERDDTAHRVKIQVIATISREILSEKFRKFNQTLNARLTLTKINQSSHRKAIEYLEKIINNSINYSNRQKNTHSDYKKSIESIAVSIKKIEDNDLLKKSLIFSALSLNESYLVNLIRSKIIPLVQDNQILYEVLKSTLLNNLSNKTTRDKIASAYFQNYKLQKNYYDLRNKLAHSMDSVSLDGMKAYFVDEKTYQANKVKGKGRMQIPHVNINLLLNDLLDYGENITDLDNIQ
ncbi:hypothetical protein EFN64_08275 [Leuconostoc citreum]|uniref:hypothetical protein n=1 Tax=Lactobacillales TaxID=186826 RepID=UPI000EE4CB44|nr:MULTISPECIES: hypothetical protein [Lactobacillales]MCT3054746.1 hypothetical protein [Leuconostoc citreum]MCT3062952.1 hypothetical protein [Leuconostoc citreum]MCT3073732.1 hypothetical protein [Leuconostoc citreum]HCM89202.1 hypothetical protein [Vagococcus sp.]